MDFKEIQRFAIKWAWGAVVAFNLLFIYAIVQQVIIGKPFGSKPVPDLLLILLELLPLLLLFLLISIRLKTIINDAGIHYRFYPFQFKTTTIEWHELNNVYMRTYNSFYEYGGWGIRTGSAKTGKAINTSASCNKGLQLRFTNGKLLLIGTRKPEEMERVIEHIINTGKIQRII